MATAVAPGVQNVNAKRLAALPAEVAAEMKEIMGKNIIKECDMNSELQSEAMDLIISSIEKNPTNFEAASRAIKENMDKKFGPQWHCVIGEGFGFEVTYQSSSLLWMYFQAQLSVLVFKCG